MINKPFDYNLIFDFAESYLPSGFKNINAEDPIVKKLDELMKMNGQFLIVMDLTQVKIIYTSQNCVEMVDVGVEANQVTPYEMFEAVHPDDVERFGMGRAKMISTDKDLFIAKKGSSLLSTNIRMRRPDKGYTDQLFQCYMFYSSTPHNAVYEIQVNTDIDWFKFKKNNYHFYSGNDVSLFRFPDKELLVLNHGLSPRELEIVQLIEKGMSSQEISEKLFLSIHTVNTHRSNIIERSGKTQISDVIYKLKEQGVL
jgi:hypothetical protein